MAQLDDLHEKAVLGKTQNILHELEIESKSNNYLIKFDLHLNVIERSLSTTKHSSPPITISDSSLSTSPIVIPKATRPPPPVSFPLIVQQVRAMKRFEIERNLPIQTCDTIDRVKAHLGHRLVEMKNKQCSHCLHLSAAETTGIVPKPIYNRDLAIDLLKLTNTIIIETNYVFKAQSALLLQVLLVEYIDGELQYCLDLDGYKSNGKPRLSNMNLLIAGGDTDKSKRIENALYLIFCLKYVEGVIRQQQHSSQILSQDKQQVPMSRERSMTITTNAYSLTIKQPERMSLTSLEIITDTLLELMEACMNDIPDCEWLAQWQELAKRFAFQFNPASYPRAINVHCEIDGNLRPGADVRPNRLGQRFSDVGSSSSQSPRSSVQIRANQSVVSQQRGQHDMEATKEEDIAMSKDFTDGVKPGEIIEKPWKFNENRPDIKPMPIKGPYTDYDYWDEDHVRMPCSKHYAYKNGQLIWPIISQHLTSLQKKCENHTVKFKDLKSPPLLKIATNRSVTMSQEQAAALLACAFFCLFPYRSYPSPTKEYEHFQDPNFETLYRDVRQNKLEKLKCILHYFNRVTENMPNGVITFQRVSLPKDRFPSWRELNIGLCDLSMTTGKKIEDIKNVLQVDFANKYIGGGVLGGGCVQEEIRFTICPEMLVSLLVCEVMDKNECIFLIGCERYSSYKGYADSFEYAGDYQDNTPRDGWGRKWCHVIAMDAVYFRNPSDQYDMKLVERELLKAYTGFRPREDEADYKFGIATGNWGCGAFHGDKQLKGIG
ncbi:unnamed protein product [Rotaria sp. Silwood2]|nr:unnamed protein product [Rotaria sp. Silwood2]